MRSPEEPLLTQPAAEPHGQTWGVGLQYLAIAAAARACQLADRKDSRRLTTPRPGTALLHSAEAVLPAWEILAKRFETAAALSLQQDRLIAL